MKQKLFLDVAKRLEKDDSYHLEEKRHRHYIVNHFKVEASNQKKIGRELGDYYTIRFKENILFQEAKLLTKEVRKILDKMIKGYHNLGTTLVIGLGNSSVISDALGPSVTNKVMATNHYDDFLTIPKVALFVPEVIGKTGISSFKLISMVVSDLKPDTIIIIDSLATSIKEQLNAAIEISDAGIIPGSALKDNKEINRNTFHIPVIAIGIPTIFDANDTLYTTPNVSYVVEQSSIIIANALNSLFMQ